MNQKNQNSETYRKTNSTEHDCKTTENNRKDNARNARNARNTRNTRDTRIFCNFCSCKNAFFEKNAFFNEPKLSIPDSFSAGSTRV